MEGQLNRDADHGNDSAQRGQQGDEESSSHLREAVRRNTGLMRWFSPESDLQLTDDPVPPGL